MAPQPAQPYPPQQYPQQQYPQEPYPQEAGMAAEPAPDEPAYPAELAPAAPGPLPGLGDDPLYSSSDVAPTFDAPPAPAAPGPLPGLGDNPLYSSADAKPRKTPTDYGIAPYWGALFAVDLASVTVAVAGLEYGQELHWVGLGGFLLAPAAVHLLHGNKRGAVVSAGARAGLPVVGGLAGGLIGIIGVGGLLSFNTASSEEEFDFEGTVWKATIVLTLVGAGAGAVVGMIVPYVDSTERASPAIAPAAHARTWAPTVAPTRGGASVGIMGSF